MNTSRTASTTILALILLLLIPSGMAFAQTEAESSENVLVFQRGNRNPEVFGANRKMSFRLLQSIRTRKGVLEEIRDSSLVISGKEYQLDQFAMMEPRNRKIENVGIGIMISSAVLAVSTSATAIIYDASNRNNPAYNEFLPMIVAVLGLILSGLIYTVGLIVFSLGRSHFQVARRNCDVKVEPRTKNMIVK